MQTYFVDTAHWLALVSPRDSWNSTAKKLAASLTGRFVTSDFVLLEVADASRCPRRLKPGRTDSRLRAEKGRDPLGQGFP